MFQSKNLSIKDIFAFKNTWCRNIPGISHKPKCKTFNEVKKRKRDFAKKWLLLICVECGEELDFYYPHKTGDPMMMPVWAKDNSLARKTISNLRAVRKNIEDNWTSSKIYSADGKLCVERALYKLDIYFASKQYFALQGLPMWGLKEVLGTNHYGVLNEPQTYKEAISAINAAINLFKSDLRE